MSLIRSWALITTATLGAASAGLSAPQIHKLTASDGVAGDAIGVAVALDGNTALIGAPLDNAATGAVYVYDATTGLETAKLVASDGGVNDYFGGAVALEGTTALVGSGSFFFGTVESVYVFDTGSGQQLLKILPPPGPSIQGFGSAVELANGLAFVGAPDVAGSASIKGVVFVFNAATGEYVTRLAPSNPTECDGFGCALSANAFFTVVGCLQDTLQSQETGAVYVFLNNGWQETMRLVTSAPPGTDDLFGRSVAVQSPRIVVGAGGDSENGTLAGAAFIYDIYSGQQLYKLVASDGAPGDRFGDSVSVSNGVVLVGSSLSDSSFVDTGSAYLFQLATGHPMGKLFPHDVALGDEFGVGVAIDGDELLVGSHLNDHSGADSGAAYLFDRSIEVGVTYCFGASCPCSNNDLKAGCRNSTGVGALLEASGSGGIVADNLVLTAVNLPPNQLGVFIMGTGVQSQPFGAGLLCVGREVNRYNSLLDSGTQGTISMGPGLWWPSCSLFGYDGCFLNGQTRYFQAWYRDPGGLCQTSVNLSNGVAITFLP